MDILNSIVEIKIIPLPGDDIDHVKLACQKLIKQLSSDKETRIYISHNGDTYMCDREGNISMLPKKLNGIDLDLFADFFR